MSNFLSLFLWIYYKLKFNSWNKVENLIRGTKFARAGETGEAFVKIPKI